VHANSKKCGNIAMPGYHIIEVRKTDISLFGTTKSVRKRDEESYEKDTI